MIDNPCSAVYRKIHFKNPLRTSLQQPVLIYTREIINRFSHLSFQSPERKKAQDAFIKFSEIAKRLSTEQVLFQNNLGDPNLLNVSNRPAKLVFKLYEHSSIATRGAGTSTVEHVIGRSPTLPLSKQECFL